MTEDRVPTPRMRVGINGRHIHPAGITDTEHCAECRLAMTEDRVPTTEPRPSDEKVRAALVEVGKAEQWGQVAKGTLSTLHAAFRAEPAPPLDVAAEVAYEMKVFLHGAKAAPPVAPGWLAQIEKWRERLARDD